MTERDPPDPREAFPARRRGPRLWPWLLLVTAAATLSAALAVLAPGWRGDRRAPAAASGGTGGAGSPRRPAPAAELVVEGRRAFAGYARAGCTPHEGTGLHVALRTGAPELPVVAFVVAGFDGPASYRGRLFLTARGAGGALLRSGGEAELAIERRASGGPRALLSGRFEGSYAGAAGAGTLRGRFERCAFTARVAAPGAVR